MKKYQLLEKAMRDYPAGTVARFKSAPHVDHISSGIFRFENLNNDGKLHIVCGSGVNCVYSDGEWAVPVPESILNDKCAIHVNNDREFKLLMEHYNNNGWKYFSGVKPLTSLFFRFSGERSAISYHDGFSHSQLSYFKDYNLIAFADFAAGVGINVPVFVITSEDGVDLYLGDMCHHVFQGHGSWSYNGTFKITDRGVPIGAKVLSTKEAADMWITKANKPKSIMLIQQGAEVSVSAEQVSVKMDSGSCYWFESNDLEAIWKAYQSLNEVSYGNN